MKDEDLANVPEVVLKQQREAEQKIKDAANTPPELQPAPEPLPVQNTELPQGTPTPPEPLPIPAAPVAPAINDGTTDDGQWEHKYSVLKGKYDKEVGDLKLTVVELQAKMERQDTVIQGLNTQQLEQTPNTVALGDDLNPEDFQGWGEEMKGMVVQMNGMKATIQDQAKVIAGLKGQPAGAEADEGLTSRVKSLESEANDGRIATYLKFLNDNIKGDWRTINKDANFNAWLNQVDPISLQSRMSALSAAATDLRGSQVASIFNLYLGEVGYTADVTIADDLPAGGVNNGAGQGSRTVTVTQAEVSQAQTDFVQGRITEADFDKVYSNFQATLRRQAKA